MDAIGILVGLVLIAGVIVAIALTNKMEGRTR